MIFISIPVADHHFLSCTHRLFSSGNLNHQTTIMKASHPIRKVICPTDLSPVAQNATRYAAQLCQVIGAELELVYTHPVWSNLLLLTAETEKLTVADDLETIRHELNLLCTQILNQYNVQCSPDVEYSAMTISDALQKKCAPGTMIIAGTNGADKFTQRIFGSVTFRLTRALKVPVLIIPEGSEYSPIKELVYAWDYHPEDSCLLDLQFFAEELGCKITFLHLSAHETEISKDVFRAVAAGAKEKLNSRLNVEFSRLYTSQMRRALDDYLNERTGSILTLSYRSGKLLRRFFRREDSARTLFRHPILVLHSI